MNKLFSKIAVGIASFAMVVGVGVGIGLNVNKQANMVDAADTIAFSSDPVISYDTVAQTAGNTATVSLGTGYSVFWDGTGNNSKVTNNNPWRVYANHTLTFSTTTSAYLGKIILTISSSSNKGNFSADYGSVTQATNSNLYVTWQLDALANKSHSVTLSTSSQARVSHIDIYSLDEENSSAGLTDLANPNPQYNDLNKTVSWTTDAHASKYQVKVDEGSYSDIATETYDASGLSTGSQHTVYIKAVGDEINYSSVEGSVTFTPTAPFASKNYVLCTSTTDLEAGASYIITNGTTGTVKTMSTVNSDNNRPETNITITNSQAATAQDTLTVALGGSSGAWTFSTENYLGTAGYLASGTSSNNHLRVNASADNCTISFNGNAAVITFSTNTGGRNIVRYNSSSKWFACYGANNTQADVYLWREYTSKTPSSLAVTGSPTKLTGYFDSDTFDPTGITGYQVTYSDASTKTVPASDIVWPPLTANMGKIKGSYTERGTTLYTPEYDISVAADTMYIEVSGTMITSYYTTDNQWDKGNLVVQAKYTSGKNTTDVTSSATFTYYTDSEMNNAVASPAALGQGENQTIYVKATYSDVSNATGYAQVVSVIVEHGTVQSDPLTADEAITKGLALGSNGVTAKDYYISGVVSNVEENSLNDPEKKYATFVLDDSNASANFKAYHIQADEGCANYSDLRAGAEVLIKCKIYKFNTTTIENSSTGAAILSISYIAPTLTDISLNKTELLLGVGEEETLVASPIPVGAELGEITWTSSNGEAATVNSSGKVTAVGVGTTTITASASGFSKICSVSVFEKAVLKYVGDSSVNANTLTSEELTSALNLDTNTFTVTYDKNGATSEMYLVKNEGVRMYATRQTTNGNKFTVTSPNNIIDRIKISFTAGESVAEVSSKSNIINGTDGSYSIGADEFTLFNNNSSVTSNSNVQVKFSKIEIFYRNKTATERVESLSTQTALAYHYEGNSTDGYTYSNIVMRFGGKVSKDLWNELDTNEHKITGFGVILMDGEMVKNAGDVADAMLYMASSTVSEDLNTYLAIDYFVPIASMNEKIGADSNNYFWNLRVSVDEAEMDKMYTAVAYIKVGDEFVLMNMARESVETIAADYLNNRGYDQSAAAASLQYIVDNA